MKTRHVPMYLLTMTAALFLLAPAVEAGTCTLEVRYYVACMVGSPAGELAAYQGCALVFTTTQVVPYAKCQAGL